MLQYDLSGTELARHDGPVAVPTEGELLVVLVALLLLEGLSYADLRNHALSLKQDQQEPLAVVIEDRLAPLACELGTGKQLRERLAQLVGLRVVRD